MCLGTEAVVSENSDIEDTREEILIRGKWIFENASSLDEVVTALQRQIEYIKYLQEQGWELVNPVADDYGLLHKQN